MLETTQGIITEVPQNPRRINAIIYSTLHNGNKYAQPQSGQLSLSDKDTYIKQVNDGTITNERNKALLDSIPGRDTTGLAYNVFRDIRQVGASPPVPDLTENMAVLVGRVFLRRLNFQSSQLDYDTLEKFVMTPEIKNQDVLAFQQRFNNYLQSLVTSNTDVLQITKMIQAGNSLGEIAFGTEKWETAQQIALLQSLARKRAQYNTLHPMVNAQKEIPQAVQDDLKAILEAPAVVNENQVANITISEVSQIEQNQIFGTIAVHGSDWSELNLSHRAIDDETGDHGMTLTKESLQQEGLLPKHKVTLNGVTLLFSEAYSVDDYVAFVGYVQQGANAFVARTFYLSQSQGMWRYLPGYSHAPLPGIPRFLKGHSEQSIMLPFPVQYALNQIYQDQPTVKEVDNPYFYFEGTAKNLQAAYADTATYRGEVGENPILLEGNFKSKEGKVKPQEVTFAHPEKDSPNFDSMLLTWKQKTSLYGDVTAEVYPSKDGRLQFMFCRDSRNRVWIGGIEDATKKITSVGLRDTWIYAGDLVTPAYEYSVQSDIYGNYDDQKGGRYIDMFENYLQHIPVIQEYMQKKGIN